MSAPSQRSIADHYMALRSFGGHHTLLNETAETMEQLLARIAAYEEYQSRLDLPEPVLNEFTDNSNNDPVNTPDEDR